jgi:arylsulfatase
LKDTELPPLDPIGTTEIRTGLDGKPFPPLDVTRPWDSFSDDEKNLFSRVAEVYTGFLAHQTTRSAACSACSRSSAGAKTPS